MKIGMKLSEARSQCTRFSFCKNTVYKNISLRFGKKKEHLKNMLNLRFEEKKNIFQKNK